MQFKISLQKGNIGVLPKSALIRYFILEFIIQIKQF